MNALRNESSPYLLQHASNPVHWHPWNEQTLEKARLADKPLLISIGYSACHWCHVMEKESFMDPELAEAMNSGFFCIKIDREERPDVDHIYMQAVQMMNSQGGWPLHAFALPDGKPFFGGTYFRPEQWRSVLHNISRLWQERRADLVRQAMQVYHALSGEDHFQGKEHQSIQPEELLQSLLNQENRWDSIYGGLNGAPKFPLPVNLLLLLQMQRFLSGNTLAETQVKTDFFGDQLFLSLRKMAEGGLYDQIAGGFARYSTDRYWKIPHFEKMLYDNAQLISLYAQAWQYARDHERYKKECPTLKRIVYECIDFINKELRSPAGLFYAALDADSEGEEGKYYTWTRAEIDQILGDSSASFCAYYGVEAEGLWENGHSVLCITDKPAPENLEVSRNKLLDARKKRIPPALDYKILTSWNALMIKALLLTGKLFEDVELSKQGEQSLLVLMNTLWPERQQLYHRSANGNTGIPAMLDDIALLADALLEVPGDSEIQAASLIESLISMAIENYHDTGDGYFYFSRDSDTTLIVRKKETQDTVIPSSCSVMARVLYQQGIRTGNQHYIELSERMLNGMRTSLLQYPLSFAGWGNLLLESATPENILKGLSGLSGPHCSPDGICNI